ncbi:MAG: Arc family DNA-binding protein [Gammaproteobacteria bacterium]
MPSSITLKNIPDDVYSRLKATAELHHRSINSEIIVCLERVLMPQQLSPAEFISRARELRSRLPKQKFKCADIAAAIQQGRS